ncbi:MAG: enoyl-CoA hydratase/isomerase family protein [Bacteroidetes bacterium]|nr:enoyl-CoA hydratase/isomerase family protein [Bacteroidota bacterium]
MNVLANNDFYEVYSNDDIAFIEIKEKVFDLITDVQLSETLLQLINDIDHKQDTKALLFYNHPDSFSDAQYDRFINRVLEKEKVHQDGRPNITERNVRFREINILNTLIKRIGAVQKIVVSALQGSVVTPFVGAAMVADFRYAAEGTILSMIHNKYGLHPAGGLPYFLSHTVHHSKALELQLQDQITAEEALENGLLNKILPRENFKDHLIHEIHKITVKPYSTIRDTKRLTNYSREALKDYFDFEAGLLNL